MPRGRNVFTFLISLCCTICAMGVLAQAPKSSTKSNENDIPLAELFQKLEASESLTFSYILQDINGVDVDTTFVKTWDALQAELPRLGFQFRKENDALILIAKRGVDLSKTLDQLTLQITNGSEPLVGASVQSPDGRIWVTDATGKAVLSGSEVPQALTVRYVGYVTERIENIGPSLSSITMRRDTMITALAEVIAPLPSRFLEPVSSVLQSKDAAAFNARPLPPVALNNFGFVGIAGVNSLDGQSALPAIRGSQGSETLVELDGIPLYHIDHLFGLFSAINPQAVERVNLYRSHYPADRGGFRGGMMDIQSIPNNLNSLQLNVDQLSAAATLTGISGPVRFLASGRSSLGNVSGTTTFQEAGAVNDALDGITTVTTPDFSYYDGYIRLDVVPSGSRWSGMVNGYSSKDEYSYGSDSREIIDDRRRPLTLEGSYVEESSWRNLGFGASLHYKLENVSYTLSAHRTNYEQSLDANSDFSVSNLIGTRLVEAIDNDLDNTITDQQIELSVRNNKGTNSWSAGIQGQFLQTQARFSFRVRAPLDIDRTGTRLHAFATREQAIGKDFSINTGLRATQSIDLNRAWLSPRAILTYHVPSSEAAGSLRIHGGYSYTRQAARALQHENQFGQNYTILVLDEKEGDPQAEAHNYTLGFSKETEKFNISVEGYYRNLPGILATLSSTIGVNNDRTIGTPLPTFNTFSGEGEVLGVDVDILYESGNFSGQLAYTLSRSQQSFLAVSRGAWQRAPDDRRHRLATTHSYTHGRWSGGFNFEAASGLVYNDLNVVSEASDREQLDPNAFQEQLPAYHRLDLFGKFEQPFPRSHAANVGKTQEKPVRLPQHQKSFSVGLRLYNALNRANVTQRQYILNLNTDAQRPTLTALGTDVALLGRVLLVEVGVKF